MLVHGNKHTIGVRSIFFKVISNNLQQKTFFTKLENLLVNATYADSHFYQQRQGIILLL